MSDSAGGPGDATRLRSDLRHMLGDGFAFSLMVGVGESYVAPFALALGLGDVAAGLVATLPMLAGAALQLVTPAAVGWLGSHKRWVVACAALQAMTFVPLVTGALAGSMPTALLFISVSLYWGLGMATGPAWNTWAGTLVPARIRAEYFARRSVWSQVALLLGLALGAGLIARFRAGEDPLSAYAWAFACALVARGLSARFLSLQSEARPVPVGETRISPAVIRAHLSRDGRGRLIVFLLVFQSSVWIAAPYFTPYMLGPLALGAAGFAALTGAAFLARIVALPALGRLVRRSGSRRVLWVGGIGIVPLPCLWLVSDSLVWLLALQLASGVAWAAFELATLLSFFEHIPSTARTSVLSVYNLASAFAIASGSLIGAGLLHATGGGASAYVALFLCSSGLRLAALLLLRGIADVRPSQAWAMPLRTLGLRPSSGAVQRPVLPAIDEGE